MKNSVRIALFALPVLSAGAVAAWSTTAAISTRQFPKVKEIENAVEAVRTSRSNVPTASALQSFSDESFARSLRPSLRPPPPKPKIVDKPKARPTSPVVRTAPAPPLRVNVTLIGTVIQEKDSHAVLKNQAGVVLVLRVGDHLPAPDDTIVVKAIEADSVIVGRKTQTAVIKVQKK